MYWCLACFNTLATHKPPKKTLATQRALAHRLLTGHTTFRFLPGCGTLAAPRFPITLTRTERHVCQKNSLVVQADELVKGTERARTQWLGAENREAWHGREKHIFWRWNFHPVLYKFFGLGVICSDNRHHDAEVHNRMTRVSLSLPCSMYFSTLGIK